MGSNTAQYKINDDKNESCRATLVDSQKKKTPEKTHDIGNEHDRSTLMLV